VRELLGNWPETDVRFIVVTDGERILGLGDLGAGGTGIPLGKLALYTACAGVPARYCLPIVLDVGTDNQALLDDPFYLGLRQRRVRGQEYMAFVDEFVKAVRSLYPKCCIQWEDFANRNAVPILSRYRDEICSFNDDIQGTAGVALAGIYASLRVTDLADFQKPFAQDWPPISGFVEAIELLQPTGIIGVSAMPGLFTPVVILAMARINERPLIFPYSNPNSRSECTAEEACGRMVGPSLLAAARFRRWRSTGAGSYPDRATTSTSSRRSEWRSSLQKPAVSRMKCSSSRREPLRSR
jgi:malate dehydrogenase (oxaloacetate-decarboxylating)(NADP+)